VANFEYLGSLGLQFRMTWEGGGGKGGEKGGGGGSQTSVMVPGTVGGPLAVHEM